jgi:hypothetical protein
MAWQKASEEKEDLDPKLNGDSFLQILGYAAMPKRKRERHRAAERLDIVDFRDTLAEIEEEGDPMEREEAIGVVLICGFFALTSLSCIYIIWKDLDKQSTIW